MNSFDTKLALFLEDSRFHNLVVFCNSSEDTERRVFTIENTVHEKNSELRKYQEDLVGVEMAKNMIRDAMLKNAPDEIRVLLLVGNKISHEAQDTLLKVLEDPSEGLKIICVFPKLNLLPTLMSRFSMVYTSEVHTFDKWAEDFYKMLLEDKLQDVSTFVKKESKQDSSQKMEAILRYIVSKKIKGDLSSEVAKCVSYSKDRSPSIKMLFEHIACLIELNKKENVK